MPPCDRASPRDLTRDDHASDDVSPGTGGGRVGTGGTAERNTRGTAEHPDKWAVELVGITGWPGPAEVRLRKLLKLALRSFGLKVITCRRTAGQP